MDIRYCEMEGGFRTYHDARVHEQLKGKVMARLFICGHCNSYHRTFRSLDETKEVNVVDRELLKVGVISPIWFDNYEIFKDHLDSFNGIDLILTDGIRGSNTLAEMYAKEKGIRVEVFAPDIKGRKPIMAWLIANNKIQALCDKLIVFGGTINYASDIRTNALRSGKEVKFIQV